MNHEKKSLRISTIIKDKYQCQRQNNGYHKGKLTLDHHTPRCLFDVKTQQGDNWLDFHKDRQDNLQTLCQRHHRLKDKNTQKRKHILERTLAGEEFPLDKHMVEFKQKITQKQIDWLIKFLEEN